MATQAVTTQTFEKTITDNDIVFVDFWATWCGPCRMVAPVVEEIANEHPEYKVGKVNVDEQPELAQQFNVMSIPTLLVFKNGQLYKSSIGAQPKASILALFD